MTGETHPELQRYRDITNAQRRLRVEIERYDRDRANSLTKLHKGGWSLAVIAKEIGLSRSRVQQLIERGRRDNG